MPEIAAEIDPYNNLKAPGYLKRNIQTREQTIFERVTANGYRVRLIASEPLAPTEVSHIGGRYQFVQDIAENDPRAVSPGKDPKNPQIELEPEEQVFSPRLIEISGAWFNETTDQIPMRVMLVVTKVKDFEQQKQQFESKKQNDPKLGKLVNGLGRHEVLFSKLCPEYYHANSNGLAIQACNQGIPIVGHPEKFLSVHVPFLTPKYSGYTPEYGKYAVLHDLVANLSNSLEALAADEYLNGLSVIQTSGIGSLPDGQRKIDAIDLFVQVDRVSKKNGLNGKSITEARPYKAHEAQQSYLVNEYRQPLYEPDIRTLPNSSKSVDLGLYRITKTPRWSKWIDFYQKENEEAEFGVPSKKLTGSGDEVEIVAVPQYIGEPVNPNVGKWNPNFGLTHAQQMRNYMLVLANCRRRQPTGVTIFSMEEDRIDQRDSLKGSKLVATNPGANPGAHFPDSPSNKGVPCRSALFRFKVKDTDNAVRERKIWATKIKPVTHRDYKATFVATTHMLRSNSANFAVVHPTTGDVLIDLNFARPHVITDENIWSSALYNFSMAAMLAAVIGYWSERGVKFTTQRQTISGMDSGGLPLGSIAGDEFTRTFIEVEGNSELIRDGKVYVNPICRIHTGDYSDDARRSLYEQGYREYTQKELDAEAKLPDDWMPEIDGSYEEYVLRDTWVEALQAYIPLWQVNSAYGHKNARVAAIMQRMSQYINLPTFYGDVVRKEKGGEIFAPDKIPMIRDKSGNMVPVKSHATGFFFHMTAEDYERIGVAMKREMRMAELNMRAILKFLGIEVDRKEGGHEWQGEGEFMPIDELGNYNPNAEKVEITDRGETTFQFVNRWIGTFNYKTYQFYQKLLKGKNGPYHQSQTGKVDLRYVPTAPQEVQDAQAIDSSDVGHITMPNDESINAYRDRLNQIAGQQWDINFCWQEIGQQVTSLSELYELESQMLADSSIDPITRANRKHAFNILLQDFRSRISATTDKKLKQQLLG